MIKAFKRVSLIALAGIMTVGMMAVSFMNVHAATPTDEAKIKVGKTLTINGTKWPNIETFEFELEALQGYTNPNASTTVDGQTIPAAQVPMPTGATGTKATKTVGDFTTAATGDTATARTRTDFFPNIKYTTAGYYLYRMTEKIPATKVPGVVYDESSYYVVVYVVNNVDAQGNTTDGVHVESVTAWHNAKNSDAHQPNLKDIASNGKTNGDDASGDNNGENPAANNTWGNSGDQRYDGLGKVGKSEDPDPDDPNNTNGDDRNVLDAYKFWNKQEMHDVSITKNVKGNLGDKTKQFEFTVTVTGLESGEAYTIEKTGAPTLVSATKGAVDNSANTITADATGACTFLVKMTDDQGIKIKNIPNGVTYQVSEAASNHTPSYAVTSSNTAKDFTYTAVTGAAAKAAPSETYYTTNDGTDTAVADVTTLDDADTVYTKSANAAAAVIASKSGNTNGEKETALATAVETVNSTDGDITVAYTNERNLETITGIPMVAMYFGLAGLVMLIAFAAVRGRKNETLKEM